MSKWLAKLFGFKQHIAHGMWTKSNCVSALQKITPSLFEQAFEINTSFKRPVYLPSQVIMTTAHFGPESGAGNEQQFMVQGAGATTQQQPLHLIGNIGTI